MALAPVFDRFGSDKRLAILEVDRLNEKEAFAGTAKSPSPARLRINSAKIPDEYNAAPSRIFLIDPDGKLLAKNIEASQLYSQLDSLLTATTSSDARVRVEKIAPARNGVIGTFRSIPKPHRTEAATFRIVDGRLMKGSGALTCLTDGLMPNSDDAPTQNVYFDPGTLEGRLGMDLGSVTPIAQINTYSRHKSTRSPQVYLVYGSDGSSTSFDLNPKIGRDPLSCGWSLIASIDTRSSSEKPGGQVGVSIGDSTNPLGKYRHLLFVTFVTEMQDLWGHTFYGEMDVVRQNQSAD